MHLLGKGFFKFFPSRHPQPILESMVAQTGFFAIARPVLFAFLPIFNILLVKLTPT